MIEVVQGALPIVLGMPHTGTDVPPDVWETLNETGRALADTDWHIERLYNGLGLDVSTVRTPLHRYVIDVNRGPDGANLYPGLNTTGLCPLTDFDGVAIYRDGAAPDEAEVARRTDLYHTPYHNALSTELARVRAKHGVALLYDCHSIRSVIPPSLRRNLTRSEHWNKFIHKLCTDHRTGGHHPVPRGTELYFGAEWPFQGRLDNAPLWPTC